MSAAPQYSARQLFAHTAPLLEEERDSCGFALLTNGEHPVLLHRPRPWPTFAADDNPRYAFKRKPSDILQQGLDGQETDGSGRGLQVGNSRESVLAVFHGDAPPDVRLARDFTQRPAQHVPQALRALR